MLVLKMHIEQVSDMMKKKIKITDRQLSRETIVSEASDEPSYGTVFALTIQDR